MIEQANRMKDAPLSKIREIMSRANFLSAEGRDIVHLEIGEPDYETPKYIVDAAKKALDEGKTHYPPVPGIPELRVTIADKLNKDCNTSYAADEILVTSGVSHGIFLAIMSFLNEGDEILIPSPAYLAYMTAPIIAGAKVKYYSLTEESGYQIDIENLKSQITEKTKMIVLISPHNPTGTVLNENTLAEISKIAIENNLIVVSDEIYQGIVYDNIKATSIASLPGMKERTILMNGFSKYYVMTGWRLGYIACSKELIDPMMRLTFYSVTSANTFVQWAGITALTGDDSECREMLKEYERRRNLIYEGINSIDGISCVKPEGAFYVFVNIKKLGITSNEFCSFILEKYGVATVPGHVFGDDGEGYVRISYANSFENIEKGLSRISEGVKHLNLIKDDISFVK